MDLNFTPEQNAFRAEVRAFLRTHLPDAVRQTVYREQKVAKPDHQAWQRTLSKQGWLAPGWPKAYGGAGWGPVERFIYDEEYHLAGAPQANIPALDLLGPVLIEFGTEAQKKRFLPPILNSDDWWCQGFSEPQAGSDLAALATRAVREGDHYVINGTKLWTSHAHLANWMFALVRTSIEEKKQAGISFILLPMDDPGVSVSPIVTLGGAHAVNQVTLENVRVPAENLVGREGGAWDITKFLLGHERLVGAMIGPSGKFLAQLKTLAREIKRQGRPLGEEARFAERLAALETELMALKMTAYRVLADEVAGHAPGPVVSVLKIKGSELNQQLAQLLMEVSGRQAFVDPLLSPQDADMLGRDDLAYMTGLYLDRRKLTIYGGAGEIQRNIIAKRILRI